MTSMILVYDQVAPVQQFSHTLETILTVGMQVL